MSAQVEPILKLFIACRNNDNFVKLENNNDLNVEEKIKLTFEKIKTHPFLIKNPIESKNIALFRIKLLGLY